MANPETLAKVAEIGGACTAFLCGVNSWVNQNSGVMSLVGICVGAVIGVCGLLINWHYTKKRDARELEAHNLQFFSNRN